MTIGELAPRVGVATSALRYWEKRGLLPVPDRISGQRRSPESAVGLVGMVLLLSSCCCAARPEMSVDENLELGAWVFRRDKQRVEQAKERIYEHYPALAERRQVNAGTLSGGQQRMLEIARILMPDPSIILLDEPSAGLSPKIAKEVYQDVRRLRELGKTIVLVDQNLNHAVPSSDHLYVMELGQVSGHGSTGELGDDLRRIVSSWLSIT